MFWELLEAVIKCMIVFQVLHFDPVTEILNTMSHLYFNKDSDYSKKNTSENEVFRSTSAADLLHTVLKSGRYLLVQMPEAATVGVLRKRVFFKISQNSRKFLCQRKHLWILENFKEWLFTEQLWTTASESGYCNIEARDIDDICCRELDAMLIASAKIPERKRRISQPSFYGHLPDY